MELDATAAGKKWETSQKRRGKPLKPSNQRTATVPIPYDVSCGIASAGSSNEMGPSPISSDDTEFNLITFCGSSPATLNQTSALDFLLKDTSHYGYDLLSEDLSFSS